MKDPKTRMHSKECWDQMEKQRKIQDEWLKDWPNHCKHCKGWGGFWTQYDPSPSGVSLGSGYLEDFEPCSECAEKNICPRCGGKLDKMYQDPMNDVMICDNCEWYDDDPDGMPNDPECICWINDYYYDSYDSEEEGE